MEFEFYCPCGKLLTAEKEWIGKRAQCPACSNVLRVPKPNRVAEVAGPTQQQIRQTAEEQAPRMSPTEPQPIEAGEASQPPQRQQPAETPQEQPEATPQAAEESDSRHPQRHPTHDDSQTAVVMAEMVDEIVDLKNAIGQLKIAASLRGDSAVSKAVIPVAVLVLVSVAFLLGRMTQTPEPVTAALAPSDLPVGVVAAVEPAGDQPSNMDDLADVTTTIGKIDLPDKMDPLAEAAPQPPTLPVVTVTGVDDADAELQDEHARPDDSDVTGGQAGAQLWQSIETPSNAEIAMAPTLSKPVSVAGVSDAETVVMQRPTVGPEALASVLNEWGAAIRLQRLINCHERNVYIAGTDEGVSLFLDPNRASVSVTLAHEATGDEVLEAVAANGNDLLSLLKVCREFSAERVIADKMAGQMLHMLVFGARRETAEGSADKMVTFVPGITTDLLALAQQFGPPTAREWWARTNMQGLQMSGLVFWWGQVGVAAREDGQITHVLLRGPRG